MKVPNNAIKVLIPDSEDHELLALQVINCLSLEKNAEVYIMSSKNRGYLRFSRYVKKYIFNPYSTVNEWINNINICIEHYEIDIILPVFELGAKNLIENKALIKQKLCDMPNLSSFNIAGNKGLLYHHMIKNGFLCPKSIVVENKELPDISGLKFPLIAKPVEGYGGGQHIKIFDTYREVQEYFKRISYSQNTILQEYISGHDMSCNVLCKNGRLIAHTIQKGKMYLNGEASPQIGFNFIENSELLILIKQLMKSLDWSGVANIDCRYDTSSQSFKIIEINTRYWINVDASAKVNINFPYLHCLASLNRTIKIPESKSIEYLNLKGLVRSVMSNPFLLFRLRFVLNNTALSYAIKDPIPIIYKFVWRTKNVILKKLRINT